MTLRVANIAATAIPSTLTDLTVTNNLTLSAGTANGVLYLNGSKVATSGSALTYNGSSQLRVGSGAAGYLLARSGEIVAGEDSSGMFYGYGFGVNPAVPMFFGNTNTSYQESRAIAATGYHSWHVGSEAMRLNSTGLGIGTTPTSKLEVAANVAALGIFRNTTAISYSSIRIYNDQNSAARALEFDYAGSSYASALLTGGPTGESAAIYTTGAYPLVLGTNATSRAVLDSSGNLGLGVTPSAWFTPNSFRAFQLTNGASIHGQLAAGTQLTGVSNNWFANSAGTDTYINNGFATQYRQWNGAHFWFIAPSGTAGGTISFTQAMTLDASGNLLLGQTSDALTQANRVVIGINGATDSIFSMRAGTTLIGYLYALSGSFSVASNNAPIVFLTGSAGSAERARILSSSPTLILGNGETAASPTDSGINATSGSGTDIAGASLTIRGGRGSGAGAGGSIIFTTALAGASGTALNTSTERIRIKQQGQMRFIPLAADPAGAENGDVYYNSATNKLRVYAGGAWVDLH